MANVAFLVDDLPVPALVVSVVTGALVCNQALRELASEIVQSPADGSSRLEAEIDAQAILHAAKGVPIGSTVAVDLEIGAAGRRARFEATARRTDDGRVLFVVDRKARDASVDGDGLFERAPAMLHAIGQDGRIQRVSDVWLERFGYSREEVIGRRSTDFLTEESRVRATDEVLPAFFREGRCDDVRYQWLCKSGKIVDVRLSATAERDARGNVLRSYAVMVDVTEELRLAAEAERARKLEKDILQAQKMESLGLLAGGVAHDFNNLLVAIIGNADLAISHLSPSSPVNEMLHDISTASRHAADLCRQLLAYSGKGRFVVGRIDLSQSVREILQILEVSVGKGTLLRTNFSPGSTFIEGDQTQIRQIVMNLVSNAAESNAGKRGIVTVSTGHSHLDAAAIAQTLIPDAAPGPYAWVDVSDTGVGMSAETRARIFEPFFSSKGAGRGLGLAAVLGIVRGHRGTIRLYSEVGRGTSFKVFFPALDAPAHAASDARATTRQRGGVLVVDDQEFVRRTLRRVLEDAGYEVVTANDGDEALMVFQSRSDDFLCVLLDVMMPGRGGIETLRDMRELRPEVPIVLTSGYNEQDALQDLVGRCVAGFLQKPFHVADLLAAIDRACNPAASPD